MTTKSLLIGTVAFIALSGAANAGQLDGWYVGLEGGANWVEDWDHTRLPGAVASSASFDAGWTVLATVGHGLGSNFRAEFEAGYRDNGADGYTTGGNPIATMSADLSEVTFMANLLYDIALTPSLTLSAGAGAGADFAMLDFISDTASVSDDTWSFAYQGIAGMSYALTNNASLFANYRYLRVADPDFDFRPALTLQFEGDDFVKHSVTIGVRYAFGAAAAPEAAIAPPPPPAPVEEVQMAAEFIVFFGHNKTNLVPEALRVISEAAAAAKKFGSANIRVVGHADRSGSDAYNSALSMRRGNVVKDALAAQGIAEGSISVSSKGESDPLVPTADGVREPQNRRVNITL